MDVMRFQFPTTIAHDPKRIGSGLMLQQKQEQRQEKQIEAIYRKR